MKYFSPFVRESLIVFSLKKNKTAPSSSTNSLVPCLTLLEKAITLINFCYLLPWPLQILALTVESIISNLCYLVIRLSENRVWLSALFETSSLSFRNPPSEVSWSLLLSQQCFDRNGNCFVTYFTRQLIDSLPIFYSLFCRFPSFSFLHSCISDADSAT